MKEILIISKHSILKDPRSRKILENCLEFNFKVNCICEIKEKINNPNCKFFKIYDYFQNINKIIWFITKIDVLFLIYLSKNFRKKSFDKIILVNDFFSRSLIIFFKFFRNDKIEKKLIFDVADSYPYAMEQVLKKKSFGLNLALNKIFNNISRLKKFEKNILQYSYKVITCAEELKKRFNKNYSIDNKKIITLNNYEDKSFLKNFKKYKRKKSNKLQFIFYGSFTPARDLETVIEASKKIYKIDKNVLFTLIGLSDNWYSAQVKEICKNLKNIKLVPWIPHSKLFDFINENTIALIPGSKSNHTNSTLPFKLTQFMWLKVPQLACDANPIKAVISAAKSGVCYKSENTDDLTKKIEEFIQKKYDLEKFKKFGFKFVNQFNWESKEKSKLKKILSL